MLFTGILRLIACQDDIGDRPVGVCEPLLGALGSLTRVVVMRWHTHVAGKGPAEVVRAEMDDTRETP
jgi:hypothetical protein